MSDFLTSDYCQECGGIGYYTHFTQLFDDVQSEREQCESCEELHRQELLADRLEDEMKGN